VNSAGEPVTQYLEQNKHAVLKMVAAQTRCIDKRLSMAFL